MSSRDRILSVIDLLEFLNLNVNSFSCCFCVNGRGDCSRDACYIYLSITRLKGLASMEPVLVLLQLAINFIRLISAGDDCRLVCWDMAVKRYNMQQDLKKLNL